MGSLEERSSSLAMVLYTMMALKVKIALQKGSELPTWRGLEWDFHCRTRTRWWWDSPSSSWRRRRLWKAGMEKGCFFIEGTQIPGRKDGLAVKHPAKSAMGDGCALCGDEIDRSRRGQGQEGWQSQEGPVCGEPARVCSQVVGSFRGSSNGTAYEKDFHQHQESDGGQAVLWCFTWRGGAGDQWVARLCFGISGGWVKCGAAGNRERCFVVAGRIGGTLLVGGVEALEEEVHRAHSHVGCSVRLHGGVSTQSTPRSFDTYVELAGSRDVPSLRGSRDRSFPVSSHTRKGECF